MPARLSDRRLERPAARLLETKSLVEHRMVGSKTLREGWTMSSTALREFCEADAGEINRLAIRAFQEYSGSYSDWPALAAAYERMSDLAKTGEIVIAETSRSIVGAVAYIPPHHAKAPYFDQAWAVIRSLVVDPNSRGVGIGRALTQECINRAKRDKSPVIALHTSAIMTVALPMYLRMGFEWHHDAPAVYGVPYAVYLKRLVP
jgi:ribosomal protein S18 acetylase RimI-like enzyme